MERSSNRIEQGSMVSACRRLEGHYPLAKISVKIFCPEIVVSSQLEGHHPLSKRSGKIYCLEIVVSSQVEGHNYL